MQEGIGQDEKWRFKFSVEKTKVMVFTNKKGGQGMQVENKWEYVRKK